MTTVTMKTLTALLPEMIKEDVATFIWGVPGLGKTALVSQTAKSMGINVIDLRLNIREPVDLAGLPVADLERNMTRWMMPELLPNLDRDGERGILFLDELNTVGPSMMPVAFQLVQERCAGTHKLLPGWIPIAAGNRIKDRAAAQRMPTPLRNKLAHFTVEPDLESWIAWAANNGISPYLVAFLRFRTELLHKMPENDEQNCFPTPRAWEKVAKFLNRPADTRKHLVASIVGDGPAGELEGFLRVCHELTPVAQIIADPDGANVPDSPAVMYATAMALSKAATRQNLPGILKFIRRFKTREFEIITMVDAVRRDPTLQKTAAFGTWAVENQDVTL